MTFMSQKKMFKFEKSGTKSCECSRINLHLRIVFFEMKFTKHKSRSSLIDEHNITSLTMCKSRKYIYRDLQKLNESVEKEVFTN